MLFNRLLLLLACVPTLLFAQKGKQGIGLALSGGGAKGLAHIGILKAIDSAGLNIDYISGTSMGSIVGGLYAAGYSADSIEKIARNINWGSLLSNSIPMTSYMMEEKSEYSKYAVELPIKKNKITIPSGFLESQELWLTLERYLFPVASVKDFDKLPIPYRCIGTDLVTGEPVVFSSGSLVRSIRASMAIPGAFSPVDINGRRLVDGGVTRNFPVRDLKDMGARYTIGVSVSTPVLDPEEELDDAMTVLSQVIFIQEIRDRKEESGITDLLINVPMGSFTSASFDDADAIIDLGIAEGRKYYPHFKRLADSLRAVDPDYIYRSNRLPGVTTYKFNRVEVEGLNKVQRKAFLEQTGIDSSREFTASKLEKETRDAFAYRMYKSIIYEVHPDSAGGHHIRYLIKPESSVVLKAGVSQNSFTGFGVHLNLTARNKLTKFSRSLVSANVGENIRLMAEHLQMFGYSRPWSNRLQYYHEFQEIPSFTDFRRTGEYKAKYMTIDNRFQVSAKRRSAGGIGFQWENARLIPRVEAGRYISGSNNFFQVYAFWQHNTFNKPMYPKRGAVAEIKGGYVFSLDPDIQVFEDGTLVGVINKENISFGNYTRATANFSAVTPLVKKWAWLNRFQVGANFSRNPSLLNNFFAGGMNPTFRNQIMFAGLQEGEIASESMAAAHTGLRYNPFGAFYASLVGSVMVYDFIAKGSTEADPSWIAGGGLTVAYDLPIGPIEFTIMLTDRTRGMRTYFNFGFPFRF